MNLIKITLISLFLISFLQVANGFPTNNQNNLFQKITKQISQIFIPTFDKTLGELFPETLNNNFTRNVKQVASCYVDQIQAQGIHLNIFNASISFKMIADQYYVSFYYSQLPAIWEKDTSE